MRMSDGDGFGRVVGSSPEDDAEDVVIVRFRVLETLHDDRANTIGTAVSISLAIPRLARIGRL